jgi:hypothetical protein
VDDRVIEVLRGALDEAQKIAERFLRQEWTAITNGNVGPAVRTGDDDEPEWERNVNYQMWHCDDELDGCPEVAREWIAEAEHMARWDPSTVLRLVQRDRDLLAEYELAVKERAFAMNRTHVDADQPYLQSAAVESALKFAIDLAARFWIGEETPDG